MSDHNRVPIVGNTYPVKEDLSALGGVWDRERRCWMVPADREAEVLALVVAVPIYQCDECGAELRKPFCPSCRDEMFIVQIGGTPTGWPHRGGGS